MCKLLKSSLPKFDRLPIEFILFILTIDKVSQKNVQNNGIFLLKNFRKDYFANLKFQPINVKISAIISISKKGTIKKEYFKYYNVENPQTL